MHPNAKYEVEVGRTYGTHTVLKKVKPSTAVRWASKCGICGTEIYRTSKELVGPDGPKPCPCTSNRKSYAVKIGDMLPNGSQVIGPIVDSKWLVKCYCGSEKRLPTHRLGNQCRCHNLRLNIGQIVSGRKVVSTRRSGGKLVVECLSCKTKAQISKTNLSSKCAFCDDWDNRMGNTGEIYALVCPFTAEIRYIGSTRGRSTKRAIGHFRQRKKKAHKNVPLYKWIRDLEKDGAMPGCIRLEEICGQSVHEREIFWIQKLKSEGCRLFNINHICQD